MTTSTAERRGATRGTAPDYRMYTVEVAAKRRLCPSFLRLTLAGEGLRTFGIAGPDQRVKLMIPRPGRTVDDVPTGYDWYPRWQAMPEDIRPTMRTYTVRAYRPEAGELDIDFVLHGGDHGGPASEWASSAELGDRVALVGPDRPGTGRLWGCEWLPPETATRLLLAGDETAVPAVGAILESLPSNAVGIACLEVPTANDRQEWTKPAGVDVRWLARDGAVPHGALLEPAVSASLSELREPGAPAERHEGDEPDVDTALLWDVPGDLGGEVDCHAGEFYGWLAGEAGVIKRLRRLLVHERGIPRTAVSFMGYWRQGRCLV